MKMFGAPLSKQRVKAVKKERRRKSRRRRRRRDEGRNRGRSEKVVQGEGGRVAGP